VETFPREVVDFIRSERDQEKEKRIMASEGEGGIEVFTNLAVLFREEEKYRGVRTGKEITTTD